MAMSRSRVASVEFAERRQEQERAAAEARIAERAMRKARAEQAAQQYFADRVADAQRRTRQLDARVAELRTVLERGLRRNPRIDLEGLREQFSQPTPDLSSVGWQATPPEWSRYEPPAPSVLGRVVNGSRYQQQVTAARAEFDRAQADYEKANSQRQRRIADARQAYAARVAKERLRVDEHNRSVDAFAAALRRREPEAVSSYLGMVLDAVPLPRNFPYAAEVDWPVVRFELPGTEVVPPARAIGYDRASDEMHEVPRPVEEVTALYRLAVSQVALLCLRDLFAADPGLDVVTFRGQVRGDDLVSVSTRRGQVERVFGRDLPPEVALSSLGDPGEDTSLRWAS
jgi:restriction system protein